MNGRNVWPTEGRAASLAQTLVDKSLVVMVGEGGVGKTTTSAAIAYGRARRGGNAAVLTVDPAPRLGDALHLERIDAEPRNVALADVALTDVALTDVALRDGTLRNGTLGQLTAMRLDTKHTLDRMVEQYSPSATAAASLLSHPIYQRLVGQFGGAENYAVFQRLHELVEGGHYDSLVIDTPPAANARDVLAAPARLSGLLDTGAMSILAEPARLVARAGGFMAKAALSMLLLALERVTGSAFRNEVSQFADLFGNLLAGLDDRTRDIDALLRADDTAFVLVIRPRLADVNNALVFRRDLERLGIRIAAVIVNRVTMPSSSIARAPGDDAPRLSGLPQRLRDAVRRMETEMEELRTLERAAVDHLYRRLAEVGGPPVFVAAAREVDVASIADIAEIATELGY